MILPELTRGQADALAMVCAKYLAESRWVIAGPVEHYPEAGRLEILERRAVCELVLTAEQATWASHGSAKPTTPSHPCHGGGG